MLFMTITELVLYNGEPIGQLIILFLESYEKYHLFLDRIKTGDETWVKDVNCETNVTQPKFFLLLWS